MKPRIDPGFTPRRPQFYAARFAGGLFINNSQVMRDNPDTYKSMWTNFAADNQGDVGNNHSLYLYLQRAEVQQALSMLPQRLTRPFVDTRAR